LKIPRENVFLLFGPVDVLVQFTRLKSLDEFKEKWFNPVRMIGAKEYEPLITRTLTFIVISEGPSFTEEPFAFMFLNTQPRDLENVRKALLTIPEVLSADTVFGPYDVICSVRAKDRAELERVISYIHNNVSGVVGVVTAIVAEAGMFFF